MKVLINGIKKLLDYDSCNVHTVCIENKQFYQKTVWEIYKSVQGDSDVLKVYDKNEECNVTKYVFIINDLYNLNLNNTKTSNAILSHLKDRVNKTSLRDKCDALISSLTSFFDEVAEVSDYNVGWNNNIDITQMLKLAGFHAEFTEEPEIIYNVIKYIKVLYEILGVRLFVFINSKTIFDRDVLKVFYHQCSLEGYNILNVDVTLSSPVSEQENVVILDRDFCEIY